MKPVRNSAHIDRDGSGILKTEGKIGGAAMTAYCAYAVPLTAVTVATLTFVPPLYSQALGLPLAMVGAILFAVRLIDDWTNCEWRWSPVTWRRDVLAIWPPIAGG